MPTHEVFNQTPPLEKYNYFKNNDIFAKFLKINKLEPKIKELDAFGELLSQEKIQEFGVLANKYPPQLKTHDANGNRIDYVDYHRAYHELMKISIENGLTGMPWAHKDKGAHLVRSIKYYLMTHVDYGHLCPISMSYSSVPCLQKNSRIYESIEAKITSQKYDERFLPLSEKQGATLGMAMTEKQGGSDVRANTSRAQHISDDEYLLTGHKWFCSAPMSDAFLVLAKSNSGLSCFYLPRWVNDKKNNFFIQRLKDKVGNKSNASSEIEFENAIGYLVGNEGEGVKTIIEMATHTRLDCVTSAAAMLQQCFTLANHHGQHRQTFGKKLVDHPMMAEVLNELYLESLAATLSTLRLAQSFDDRKSPEQIQFRRITTAILKFWICRRVPQFSFEAMECLGGNGYVEDHNLARIYREAPVNSIWEGSGNIMCLDVLRVMSKEPECLDILLAELDPIQKNNPAFDKTLNSIKSMGQNDIEERQAREFVKSLALLLQASLIFRYEPNTFSGFCEKRF